jgi:hypothetical protein
VQAVLLAGHVVVNVVASAVFAAIEPVSLSHSCFIHSDEVTTVDLDSGREQVRVNLSRPELNPAGTSAGTHRLASSKSLPHMRLKLEAGVGIGQVWPLSAVSNPHPQRLRHQRHAASCASNIPIIKDFRRFVKLRHYAPNTNQLLTKYSFTTRSLALSLALFIDTIHRKNGR